MKSTSLYSEEQIRAAEQYLKEVGADDMSLDNRNGRSGRPESVRALSPDERGIRILEGVYLDFFAKDRLALIVPRYTQQLPLTWIKEAPAWSSCAVSPTRIWHPPDHRGVGHQDHRGPA